MFQEEKAFKLHVAGTKHLSKTIYRRRGLFQAQGSRVTAPVKEMLAPAVFCRQEAEKAELGSAFFFFFTLRLLQHLPLRWIFPT